ncbi:flagellar hook-basal body complex protein FliE [Buchnera aphidicola (Muscaphis stroyani)]|uniref:Flagellar hook-basal body complex protein FliE n=1 Tax=Buchnera aphidicola (Muscaphis stroyani) TaxID=1241869 RepID=A0A4D6YF16_9GAMM|nr:flagellar hook-basal body complex protein FliE [Buchnera aphidicola]QCI24180.1 flagellar hook-basal body complex protein FliE [Buchnera aphidicola (Muscaphis stroyani)]
MFINSINYQNNNTNIDFLDKKEKNNLKNNSFSSFINKALKDISNTQNHAKLNSQKFELNQSNVSLNDVMIDLQKSSISIQMAIQIRNKIVAAYQEIMNQQV